VHPPMVEGGCLFLSGTAIGWLVGLSASPTIQLVITSILATVGGIVGTLAGIERTQTKADTQGEPEAPKHIKAVKITPVPMALLLIGLIPGSILGLKARTHEWFGADPDALIARWNNTGLSKEEIAQRLFDQLYPLAASSEQKYNEKILGSDPQVLVQKWSRLGLQGPAVAQRLFDQIYPPVAASSEKKTEKSGGEASLGAQNNPHAGSLYSSIPPSEYTELRAALTPEEMRRVLRGSSNEQVRAFERSHKGLNDSCLKVAVELLLCTESNSP